MINKLFKQSGLCVVIGFIAVLRTDGQNLASQTQRDINANVTLTQGKHDKFFNTCASTGRAYLLLRKDHQEHIATAVKECGFKYLRFHGLLDDDMGIYREDKNGKPIYSWQYVDAVYDFMLETGVRPFVVLDFMPEKLASDKTTIYWEKVNITPPKDYKKWGDMVQNVVQHFTDRYGEQEVTKWFFEVWNEPDQYFFTGDLNAYIALYESSARAVKRVNKNYQVGGPAVAGNMKYISSLIQYCDSTKTPVDFISSHTYSLKGFESKDKDKKGRINQNAEGSVRVPSWEPGPPWPLGNLTYNPDGVVRETNSAKDIVLKSKMPDLPLYFTEWGLSYDYWDPLRDSYQAASFILSRLKTVRGIKAMSYCEISDVFEEDGPPTDHFHGGFGLINLQGIKKSAFFAYQFLNQLGSNEIQSSDPKSIVCSDEKETQILFWDDSFRQNVQNKEYYNKDNPPCLAGKVNISLTGLKPGKYQMTTYSVGYKQNDPYTSFITMKKSGSLSREQVNALRQQNNGQPLKETTINIDKNSDDLFKHTIYMRENDVYLLKIKPVL